MKKNIPLLFIIALVTTSCGRIALSVMANKKEVKLSSYYNEKEEKSLVLVPMVHLNRPEFFEDVRIKLDSLRKEGFVVFYEAVDYNVEDYTKQQNDTILWKARKLTGVSLTTAYNDTTNHSLPKYYKKEKYAMQTNNVIGITDDDLRVDLPIDTIINRYERKHGKIVLTDCDFDTPLLAKYDCETYTGYDALYTFRERHIEQKIVESENKKIALVYGAAHIRHFKLFLKYKQGYSELKS